MKAPRLIQVVLFVFLQGPILCSHSCSNKEGGGVCPDGSICCPITSPNGSSIVASGCLPNNPHIQGPGICCGDLTSFGTTACPGSFQCDFSLMDQSPICALQDSQNDEITMPRYKLVPSSAKSLRNIYGFPILREDRTGYGPVLAYYSSMGPILTSHQRMDLHIEAVIVVVHGSGRNADEYLYSMMSVAKLQQEFDSVNVLVIAPRFLAEEDGIFAIPVITNEVMENREPMKWNETYPAPHTWRYGANALKPSEMYSSYDAMDSVVDLFVQNAGEGGRFQKLKRIIVAGHSAGGQFTQRWCLTSNSPLWGDSVQTYEGTSVSRQLRRGNSPKITVYVVNPRSFAYLDERRWLDSHNFAKPPKERIDWCPRYNSWEWGLNKGGLDAPYVQRAVNMFDGAVKKVGERYSNRNVTYLAGKNDTEHLHGSCEDDGFQGTSRVQRSHLFYESLKVAFGKDVHSRLLVDNVGHDHSLMFQSAIGAMFRDGDGESSK